MVRVSNVGNSKRLQAVSFGAKALSQAEEDAEDNDWTLAKHFPLQLYPNRARVEYGLQLSRERYASHK